MTFLFFPLLRRFLNDSSIWNATSSGTMHAIPFPFSLIIFLFQFFFRMPHCCERRSLKSSYAKRRDSDYISSDIECCTQLYPSPLRGAQTVFIYFISSFVTCFMSNIIQKRCPKMFLRRLEFTMSDLIFITTAIKQWTSPQLLDFR